ncbi:DUF397 domain-containing protein [Streptomyces sp. NPDC020817]|uniref:DUF397 domain-containing protein n=1 Tax=Streptomyces sp. NPDC020817 TaxID=3365095 RepID=UPI0037B4E893
MKAKVREQASGLVWVKSSYSSEEGGECVEVAAPWRKSSGTTRPGGESVETVVCSCVVHVRDSKDTTLPGMTISLSAWTSFVGFVTW